MLIRWLFFVIFIFSGAALAQTSSLNVLWDANSEPDIQSYRVQRSVNSASFTDLATVSHPQTEVTDTDVSPGNLYTYRVSAIDDEGNASAFSSPVAAGLPQVLTAGVVLASGASHNVSLATFLVDPDDDLSNLTLTISQENNLTASVQGGDIVIAPNPLTFTGNASFLLRAEDPSGFFDEQTVSVSFSDQVVFTVSIPGVDFDEDGNAELQMDNFVTHTGFNANEISWSFSGGDDLDINYNANNRTLTIQSDQANWFGQNSVSATATDPDQATASGNFTVTVNGVNDAPVANVPALNVTNDPDNNVFDLKPFASDVDNSTAELDWEFFGFNDFDFQWVNQSDKILRIVALSTPAAEQGFFRVFDPQNGADTVAVALNVANDPDLVLEISINDISFDEDNSLTLELADAIVNSDYAFNDLDWTFTEGANLGFSFDPDDRELMLFADDANWFGESFFTVTAIAPDQNSASTTFNVVIDPVNDAPVSVAEAFYVSAASNNLYDMKLYATDVDNSAFELDWNFQGFSQFNFTWQDENNKILRIEPIGNPSSESGTFLVTDPQGASDNSAVNIVYSESNTNTPPHLALPGSFTTGEDSSLVVDLVSYVVDSTNTTSELSWEFTLGGNLNGSFNESNYTYTITPEKDWHGNSSVAFIVRDPGGLTDVQQVNISVESRNDIRSMAFRSQGAGELTVNFSTDVPSVVDFHYWRTLDEVLTVGSTTFRQDHSFTLLNLADTTYHFTMMVMDEDGRSLSITDSVFQSSGSTTSGEITELVVYPNPIKPSQGDREMIFTNLPENSSTVGLYTLYGQRIYETSLGTSAQEYRLNISDSSSELTSGLYIYMVRDENARLLSSGKVVVIR